MSFLEDEIEALADDIEQLLPRFQKSISGHDFLSPEDQSKFKRLALEAKSAIDTLFGSVLNDFSGHLFTATAGSSGSYLSGPTPAKVSDAIGTIRAALNHYRRKQMVGPPSHALISPIKPPYVDSKQITELRSLKNTQWDFSRLIQLCVELNTAHQQDSYFTIAMLVRAITDHVPPIFGQSNFQGVTNNYGGQKSFKKSMAHLEGSLRNIADSALHTQIRPRESVPGPAQVNFGADLAVLLAEVIRISRTS